MHNLRWKQTVGWLKTMGEGEANPSASEGEIEVIVNASYSKKGMPSTEMDFFANTTFLKDTSAMCINL